MFQTTSEKLTLFDVPVSSNDQETFCLSQQSHFFLCLINWVHLLHYWNSVSFLVGPNCLRVDHYIYSCREQPKQHMFTSQARHTQCHYCLTLCQISPQHHHPDILWEYLKSDVKTQKIVFHARRFTVQLIFDTLLSQLNISANHSLHQDGA